MATTDPEEKQEEEEQPKGPNPQVHQEGNNKRTIKKQTALSSPVKQTLPREKATSHGADSQMAMTEKTEAPNKGKNKAIWRHVPQ